MASIKENNLELNYGWPYGESGWNSGMDENIVKLGFESRKRINGILSSPPSSPSNGDAYLVGTTPTGLFSGKFANIAIYDRSSWIFIVPKNQEVVFNASNGCDYIYNDGWSLKLEEEVTPYIKVKDFNFSTGYTITDQRQCLLNIADNHYYQWNGTLPKVIAAGATPSTSGGIGAGAWVDRTDVTLRGELTDSGSTIQEIADAPAEIDILQATAIAHDQRISENDTDIAAILAAQAAGVIGYRTLALLNSNLTYAEGTIAYVTNDTTDINNGIYIKYGLSGAGGWIRSASTIPDSSITNAKLSNSFNFGGAVASATDLNTVKADGVYYLNPSNTYVNIPPSLSRVAATLYVNDAFDGANNFVHQVIKPLSNPYNVYSREVTTSSATTWFKEYQNPYMLTKGYLANGSSAQAANEDGNYFLNSSYTYTDIPSECAGVNCLLSVAEAHLPTLGRFKYQKIWFAATPNTAWVRRLDTTGSATQTWTKANASPSSVSRTQLVDLYSDIGALSSGSANDVINKTGLLFILDTSTVSGLPACGATSGFLYTEASAQNGGWGYQVFTDLTDGSNKHTRTTRPSNGTVQPWGGRLASGKTIAVFGDSITEFGTYPQQLGKILGGKALKMGFSGCRMANHNNPYYNELSMCNMAESIASGDFTDFLAAVDYIKTNYGDDDTTAANLVATTDWRAVDYVTIFFGTNDYAANVPLGTNADTNGSTFKGGINKTITQLLTAYPHLKLMFITPIWRPRINPSDGLESDNNPNGNGDYLIEFADAIIEVTGLKHVEAIDFYRRSGFSVLTQSTLLGSGDDIHPSTAGYTVLAEKISAAFRARFGK